MFKKSHSPDTWVGRFYVQCSVQRWKAFHFLKHTWLCMHLYNHVSAYVLFLFGWILLQCWRVLLTTSNCVFVLWGRCREVLVCPRRKIYFAVCHSVTFLPFTSVRFICSLLWLAFTGTRLQTDFCSRFGGLSGVIYTCTQQCWQDILQ